MTIYINKDETVFHLEMKDSSYIFRILENGEYPGAGRPDRALPGLLR